MDYIKMCEGAEEIQKLWKPKVGDWQFWLNNKTECASVSVITSLQKKYKDEVHRVWLPTQEQLQEMIKGKYKDCQDLLEMFWYEIGLNFSNQNLKQYKTFVELWLVFVMKEKWNKVWNGNDWVLV